MTKKNCICRISCVNWNMCSVDCLKLTENVTSVILQVNLIGSSQNLVFWVSLKGSYRNVYAFAQALINMEI